MNRLMMTLGAFVIMGILAPAPVTAQDKPAAKPAKAAAASPASPVNLNTATQAQLETLPGIGAASAKRIIEYRDKNGKFKKIEGPADLQRGFGPGAPSTAPLIGVDQALSVRCLSDSGNLRPRKQGVNISTRNRRPRAVGSVSAAR